MEKEKEKLELEFPDLKLTLDTLFKMIGKQTKDVNEQLRDAAKELRRKRVER